MLENVTVEKVSTYSTRKDGTPYITKKGTPFKMATIFLKDGRRISGGLFDEKMESEITCLTTGSKIILDIVKNGDFTNFKFPRPEELEMHKMREELAALKGSKTIARAKEQAIEVGGDDNIIEF